MSVVIPAVVSHCAVCGDSKNLTEYHTPVKDQLRYPTHNTYLYPSDMSRCVGLCGPCGKKHGFPICVTAAGEIVAWFEDYYKKAKRADEPEAKESRSRIRTLVSRLTSPGPYREGKWPQNHVDWVTEVDWVGVYRNLFLKSICEPIVRKRATIRGWRTWGCRYDEVMDVLEVTAPIAKRPGVLVAEECNDVLHCKPECLPPCAGCGCGIYILYKPPTKEDLENNPNIELLFFCQTKGKTRAGDLGARTQEIEPIFCLVPPTWYDAYRPDLRSKIREAIQGFFGQQIPIISPEDISNLQIGGITILEEKQEETHESD